MHHTTASICDLTGSAVNTTQRIVGVGDLTFKNYVNMNQTDSADNKGNLEEHIKIPYQY